MVIIDSTDAGELFYQKMGYAGCLIVQSKTGGIEQLLSLNNKFDVRSSKVVKDGSLNQIALNLSEPGGEMQKNYIDAFPDCDTHLQYTKDIV